MMSPAERTALVAGLAYLAGVVTVRVDGPVGWIVPISLGFVIGWLISGAAGEKGAP
jgi:hypothetical protein